MFLCIIMYVYLLVIVGLCTVCKLRGVPTAKIAVGRPNFHRWLSAGRPGVFVGGVYFSNHLLWFTCQWKRNHRFSMITNDFQSQICQQNVKLTQMLSSSSTSAFIHKVCMTLTNPAYVVLACVYINRSQDGTVPLPCACSMDLTSSYWVLHSNYRTCAELRR